jgi:L-rhamnose mutarotase
MPTERGSTTEAGQNMRVCFRLQLKPDRLEDYKQRHAHVWPEMLAALEADRGPRAWVSWAPWDSNPQPKD